MNDRLVQLAWKALDKLKIELPSWGFANTGTRFGKFIQPAAATTIEEKFSDAAQVHAVTGASPTLALHVQWDLPRWGAGCAVRPAAGVGAGDGRRSVRARSGPVCQRE